jgi:hypothetical protein
VANDGQSGVAGLIQHRHEPFAMLVVRATEQPRSTIGDPLARTMEPE